MLDFAAAKRRATTAAMAAGTRGFRPPATGREGQDHGRGRQDRQASEALTPGPRKRSDCLLVESPGQSRGLRGVASGRLLGDRLGLGAGG